MIDIRTLVSYHVPPPLVPIKVTRDVRNERKFRPANLRNVIDTCKVQITTLSLISESGSDYPIVHMGESVIL